MNCEHQADSQFDLEQAKLNNKKIQLTKTKAI